MPLALSTDGQFTYLRCETPAGFLYLASDAITHSYRDAYTNRIGGLIRTVDPRLVEQVYVDGCTIGAYTLFPGEVRDRKPTINGARGMHPRIADRFDLTLECIRRYFADIDSPLAGVFARYDDFFQLFEDFAGYVDFFLFQDLVNEQGEIGFYLPFDDFRRSPLPASVDEYEMYASGVLQFVRARNNRMRRWSEVNLS